MMNLDRALLDPDEKARSPADWKERDSRCIMVSIKKINYVRARAQRVTERSVERRSSAEEHTRRHPPKCCKRVYVYWNSCQTGIARPIIY